MQKPANARGTRDFGPTEMAKRNYVFDIIKTHFQGFGFQTIETPAIENLSTLTGKYGEEGDQLLFKILNSGDYLSKVSPSDMDAGSKALTSKISEKGLRYDLTVPFARFVAMNRNDLAFPFRRYQIQPVWRADRPQRGRYREFYQCDADVIGSNSLINELELIAMMDKSFHQLNIPVVLKFNNRKILSGIAEILNASEKIIDITVAIDKLDKIGKDGIINELSQKGISDVAIKQLEPLIDLVGSNENKVEVLKGFLQTSEIGKKGIEEVEFLLEQMKHLSINHLTIELDITLARGLNYYTGTIFEAKANAVFESSEALNGAAAVTMPNTRPMIGDLDRKPCDFFPMREAMNAATTSPNKVEAKTIGRAIS